jgi:hypothetical protein
MSDLTQSSGTLDPTAQAMQMPQPIGLMQVSPATPMEMLNRALMSGAAPETLEKMLALQERWEKNEARKAFDKAIAKAKASMPVIRKNREVNYVTDKGRTNYKFEDMAEIERTIVPILSEHGLSYRFRTTVTEKMIVVTCIISHEAGHSEENSLPGPADTSGSKNAIQAIGSTVTYLQRYTLKAALGLSASVDDDGAAATANGSGEPVATISDAEVEELKMLIEDAGGGIEETGKLCLVLGIAGLNELPSRKLPAAKKEIADFKKWKAAQ